jgi:hypothetical protein
LIEYSRAENKSEANIYIEGDGSAWLSRAQQSLNPTPENPVALKLAAEDKSQNVIYLARPCQYVNIDKNCSSDYWGNKRMAPEVIEAYMQILDNYDFKKINLIGFSGGAGIAAIIAAKRNDVITLRTVSGNIDIAAFSKLHNVSDMEGSINPESFARSLSTIPQIHFIGKEDKIITPGLFRNYIAETGDRCTKLEVINAGHGNGWEQLWSELLKQEPKCSE